MFLVVRPGAPSSALAPSRKWGKPIVHSLSFTAHGLRILHHGHRFGGARVDDTALCGRPKRGLLNEVWANSGRPRDFEEVLETNSI